MIRAGQKLLEVLINTISLLLFATVAPPSILTSPSLFKVSLANVCTISSFLSEDGGEGEKFVGSPQTDGHPHNPLVH